WLSARGYPAPRVVPTRTGEPVGIESTWLTLAARFVPGRPLTRGGGQLGLLGAALGRLHALPVPIEDPGPGFVPGPGGEPAWRVGVRAGAGCPATRGRQPGPGRPTWRGPGAAGGGLAVVARTVPRHPAGGPAGRAGPVPWRGARRRLARERGCHAGRPGGAH